MRRGSVCISCCCFDFFGNIENGGKHTGNNNRGSKGEEKKNKAVPVTNVSVVLLLLLLLLVSFCGSCEGGDEDDASYSFFFLCNDGCKLVFSLSLSMPCILSIFLFVVFGGIVNHGQRRDCRRSPRYASS